jgi:hypothetical protein
MDVWDALLRRVAAERELAAEGRWQELAESTAERLRLTAVMGPAPASARPVLEAIATMQDELIGELRLARTDTARELAEIGRGRGAVAGYAAAQGAPARPWVNDRA